MVMDWLSMLPDPYPDGSPPTTAKLPAWHGTDVHFCPTQIQRTRAWQFEMLPYVCTCYLAIGYLQWNGHRNINWLLGRITPIGFTLLLATNCHKFYQLAPLSTSTPNLLWFRLLEEAELPPRKVDSCSSSERAFMLACTRPVGISYWAMQVFMIIMTFLCRTVK